MGLSVPRRQGRALGITVSVCTALLAAACTSSVTSSPPGPAAPTSAPANSPAAAPTSPAAPAPSDSPSVAAATGCPSSGLTAKVTTSQGGAAAGSVYVPIDFSNTTSSTCTMLGYPGVSFVTSRSGGELGRAATRVPPPGTSVRLAPGHVAHAVIRIAQAANYDPSACMPVTAHWLRIYPPNQFTAIYARYTAQVCSAKLPAKLGSQLSVYAVQPGPGRAGQAP